MTKLLRHTLLVVFTMCVFGTLTACGENSESKEQLTVTKIVEMMSDKNFLSSSPGEMVERFESLLILSSRESDVSLLLFGNMGTAVSLSLRYQTGYEGKGWLLLDGELIYTAHEGDVALIQVCNKHFGNARLVDIGTGKSKWVWKIDDNFEGSLEKSEEGSTVLYLSVLQGDGP